VNVISLTEFDQLREKLTLKESKIKMMKDDLQKKREIIRSLRDEKDDTDNAKTHLQRNLNEMDDELQKLSKLELDLK
jgi:chromosome segregation ATPase